MLGGAQAGLINVTAGVSRDPALEHRIISEVSGFGRQLGRIMDAATWWPATSCTKTT